MIMQLLIMSATIYALYVNAEVTISNHELCINCVHCSYKSCTYILYTVDKNFNKSYETLKTRSFNL